MKFQFDPNQQYQLDAIFAVTELFKGQTISYRTFGVAKEETGSSQNLSLYEEGLESLYGNKLTLSNNQINNNFKRSAE